MAHILLTGASRGIGRELLSLFLADKQHRVLAVSRILPDLSDPLLENSRRSGHFIPVSCDLRGEDLDPLLEPLAKLGSLDVLLNNAGFLLNKPFLEQTDAEWQHQFQVNVFAPARLIRLVHPFLQKSGHAHVVNISSMGGFQGSSKFPGLSAYSASKAALGTLTECLAVEFRGQGISVNALALGATGTAMLSEAFPGFKAPVTAMEMAEFVAYFAIHGGRWMNGKQIPVALADP